MILSHAQAKSEEEIRVAFMTTCGVEFYVLWFSDDCICLQNTILNIFK